MEKGKTAVSIRLEITRLKNNFIFLKKSWQNIRDAQCACCIFALSKILRLGQGNELAHLLSFSLAESYPCKVLRKRKPPLVAPERKISTPKGDAHGRGKR